VVDVRHRGVVHLDLPCRSASTGLAGPSLRLASRMSSRMSSCKRAWLHWESRWNPVLRVLDRQQIHANTIWYDRKSYVYTVYIYIHIWQSIDMTPLHPITCHMKSYEVRVEGLTLSIGFFKGSNGPARERAPRLPPATARRGIATCLGWRHRRYQWTWK